MKDSYSVNFYLASATIIPVLFLAFAVESPFIGRLRKEIESSYKKRSSRGRKAITYGLRLVGMASLIAAVVGEVGALGALLRQRDYIALREFVFVSVIVLLVEVAAVPAFIIFWLPSLYAGKRWFGEFQESLGNSVSKAMDEASQSLAREFGYSLPEGEAEGEKNKPKASDDQA